MNRPLAAEPKAGARAAPPPATFELIAGLVAGRGGYAGLGRVETMARIDLVRGGVPARMLDALAGDLGVPRERLCGWLGIPRATAGRKLREGRTLDRDESERVLGLARLVGQVERIVAESGDAAGFDAAAWLAGWLQAPNAALGGRRPGDFLDTADGRELLAGLIARMQTGAYA